MGPEAFFPRTGRKIALNTRAKAAKKIPSRRSLLRFPLEEEHVTSVPASDEDGLDLTEAAIPVERLDPLGPDHLERETADPVHDIPPRRHPSARALAIPPPRFERRPSERILQKSESPDPDERQAEQRRAQPRPACCTAVLRATRSGSSPLGRCRARCGVGHWAQRAWPRSPWPTQDLRYDGEHPRNRRPGTARGDRGRRCRGSSPARPSSPDLRGSSAASAPAWRRPTLRRSRTTVRVRPAAVRRG